MELKTGSDDAGRRLDRILRKALPAHPLSLIHRLLRQGKVLVDGRRASGGDHVPAGALIVIHGKNISTAEHSGSRPSAGSPLPPAMICCRGGGLLVINKPAGLAVHGRGGLDGMVREYLADSLAPSLSFRPGPLHRLDKLSSGLIVFSTNIEGARRFSALLRERRVKKQYLALVEGRVEQEEIWRDDLVRDRNRQKTVTAADAPEPNSVRAAGARTAVTRITPLAAHANGEYSLILAEIETGRTHQIRAHAAAHGYSLAGDRKYGGASLPGGKPGGGFFLHAWKLEFENSAPPLLVAPPPDAFRECVRALFGDCLLLRQYGF